MADFAMILSAVDHALGTAGLQRYLAKQGELAADSLTADAFVQAVGALGEFQGTSAELLAKVAKPEKPPKGWPVDARAVTQRLRRQAPVMRKAGWEIEDDGGTNHRNVAIWSISRPPERDCISPSHASQPPKALENGHFSREDSCEEPAPSSRHPRTHPCAGRPHEVGTCEVARHARQEHGPPQDGMTCAHCGEPGAPGDPLLSVSIAGEDVRLHRRWFSPYQNAGLDLPPFLDRRRGGAG